MVRTTKLIAGIVLIITLGVGIWIGCVFMDSRTSPLALEKGEWRLGAQKGELTNPLLECDLAEETIASKKVDFSPELESFVNEIKKEPSITDISVYFRDLNNGPSFGIGQSETYSPASLLKVPILIAYLKWVEDVPGVLEEEILYEKPINVRYEQKFTPITPLIPGTSYTTKALLEQMVTYSDNQALVLLHMKLPPQYQNELYTLLGVDPALITSTSKELTMRQYSIFFRILFNASFLTRAHSEYALNLLTKTTFVRGVRAGVPEGIEVAHKFGERKTQGGQQQFHDCGIVYYPDHPYLICVMTRGTDATALIESIQKTSAFVYQQIDSQYGK